MDIFRIIRKDHRKIRALLEAVTGDFQNRRRQFRIAAEEVESHMRAEEAALYAWMEKSFLTVDEAYRSRAEHAEIDRLSGLLHGDNLTEEEWMKTYFNWRDRLIVHMEEEEENVLPKMREAISEAESRRLAGRMQQEKSPQADMLAVLGLSPRLPQLPERQNRNTH